MSADVEPKKRALEGVRVLDLSNVLAGPFCGTVLGEFGADVVKVELPGKGDPMRTFGTTTANGDTFVWLSEARNKKSITLDLRSEGRGVLPRTGRHADVVLENFRPGTLEKWGLGYDVLSAINPRSSCCASAPTGRPAPTATSPASRESPTDSAALRIWPASRTARR